MRTRPLLRGVALAASAVVVGLTLFATIASAQDETAEAIEAEIAELEAENEWLADQVPRQIAAIGKAELAIESTRPGLLDPESLAYLIALTGLLVFFLRRDRGLGPRSARRVAVIVAALLTLFFYAPVWAQPVEEPASDPFVDQLVEVERLLDGTRTDRLVAALEALGPYETLDVTDPPQSADPLLVPLRTVKRDHTAGYFHTLAALRLVRGDLDGALAALRQIDKRTVQSWARRSGRQGRWTTSRDHRLSIAGRTITYDVRRSASLDVRHDEAASILRSARFLFENGGSAEGTEILGEMARLGEANAARLTADAWSGAARWAKTQGLEALGDRLDALTIRYATTAERVALLEAAAARADGALMDLLIGKLSGETRLDGALLAEVQRLATSGNVDLARAILERAVVPSLARPMDLILLAFFAEDRGIDGLRMAILSRAVTKSGRSLSDDELHAIEAFVANQDDAVAAEIVRSLVLPHVSSYDDLLRIARSADDRGLPEVALAAIDRVFALSGLARVNEPVVPFAQLPPGVEALPRLDQPMSLGVAAGGLAEGIGNSLGARDYYTAALNTPIAAVLKVGALELDLNIQDVYLVRRYFDRYGPAEAARSLRRIEEEVRARLPPLPEPEDPEAIRLARLRATRDALRAKREALLVGRWAMLLPLEQVSDPVADLREEGTATTEALRELESIQWWAEKRRGLHDFFVKVRDVVPWVALVAVALGALHLALDRSRRLGDPGRLRILWHAVDRFSAALAASVVCLPAGLALGALAHWTLTRRIQRALARIE